MVVQIFCETLGVRAGMRRGLTLNILQYLISAVTP